MICLVLLCSCEEDQRIQENTTGPGKQNKPSGPEPRAEETPLSGSQIKSRPDRDTETPQTYTVCDTPPQYDVIIIIMIIIIIISGITLIIVGIHLYLHCTKGKEKTNTPQHPTGAPRTRDGSEEEARLRDPEGVQRGGAKPEPADGMSSSPVFTAPQHPASERKETEDLDEQKDNRVEKLQYEKVKLENTEFCSTVLRNQKWILDNEKETFKLQIEDREREIEEINEDMKLLETEQPPGRSSQRDQLRNRQRKHQRMKEGLEKLKLNVEENVQSIEEVINKMK